MRKLALLALAAFVSSVSFAQDAPAVKRTFRAYFDVISGQVAARDASTTSKDGVQTVNAAQQLWAGNEYELGIGYAQNWAKVPWLTTSFVVKFGINPEWIYDGNTPLGRGNGQGVYPFSDGAKGLWIRGQVGLDFSKYFSLYVDSRLLIGATLQWGWSSGAHGILLQTGVEFFAGNKPLSAADYLAGKEGRPVTMGRVSPGPLVDAFWIDFVWNATMPMGFANSLLIRPIGFGGDSAKEVADGFFIRLQETISWSNAGFSIYARIRYNIKNIAAVTYTPADGSSKYKNGVLHDLSLRAGVSYAYDFSKL